MLGKIHKLPANGTWSMLQALNVIFLYRPPLCTSPSTIGTWLSDNDGRLLSILAGVLACLGDITQFLAGQAVGYAVRSLFNRRGRVWCGVQAQAQLSLGGDRIRQDR